MDCGATHNFISTKLVVALLLLVSETLNYEVIIGSSNRVKGQGIYKGVVLKF